MQKKTPGNAQFRQKPVRLPGAARGEPARARKNRPSDIKEFH
jgi:hypothetical protein